jgi:hypothetical protein
VADYALDIHCSKPQNIFHYLLLACNACPTIYGNTELGRDCTYNVPLRRVPATVVAMERQKVLHNLIECMCIALVIQHAMHMRHIANSGLPRLTIFSHIS